MARKSRYTPDVPNIADMAKLYTNKAGMNADFFNNHFRFRDAKGNLDFAKEFSVPMTTPIRDMKLTSRVSALCLESDQPISIIKNGEIAMIVMSVDVYRHRHQELMRLLQE